MQKKSRSKKFLIVGLGNIGDEYSDTRHNIGFSILDKLSQEKNISFENKKLGSIAKFSYKGAIFILLKPTTFVNRTGKSVLYWLKKEKINTENLLVIVDNLHLPFGNLRIKSKGSNAGHNGLKDIELHLQTNCYSRLYFGIGADKKPKNQVDFVLGKWEEEEQKMLSEKIKKSIDIILSFVTEDLQTTMNKYN